MCHQSYYLLHFIGMELDLSLDLGAPSIFLRAYVYDVVLTPLPWKNIIFTCEELRNRMDEDVN